MYNELVKDIQNSKRPVLLIGGGVWWSGMAELVRELGRRLKIPCVPTWNVCDIITSDYEYYAGRIGTYGMRSGNFTIQNADLVLAIGCRFSGRITGGQVQTFAREAKIYAVDIDWEMLKTPTIKIDVPIPLDAMVFVPELLKELEHSKLPDFSWWVQLTRSWLRKYPTVLPQYYNSTGIVHPYVFAKVLSEECELGDIIVTDCGGNAVVMYQAFETKWGQRFISSHGNSPMGFSFAGALGAALAPHPKRVICVIGDGGFNMNIQELRTMTNYGLDVKTFIMDNRIYGITRQFQDTNFGSRYEASGPKGYNPPDFEKIVNAYGITSFTIPSPQELRIRIVWALKQKFPVVTIVNMKDFCTYEPRIFGWKTPIEDLYPYLSREEFSSNMLIPPIGDWQHPEMPKIEKTGWGEERHGSDV